MNPRHRDGLLGLATTTALLVAAGGPALTLLAGPAVVAALLGGLGAYFCLLVGVLSEVVPPPETWVYDASG